MYNSTSNNNCCFLYNANSYCDVVFKDDNGNILYIEKVKKGTKPTFRGELPNIEDDKEFFQWDPKITVTTCDTEYVATYQKKQRKDEDRYYEVTFYDEDKETIPTVKLIVGLGLMEFKMPVNLVAFVNTGIFISGISLLNHVLTINPVLIILIVVILLFYIYKKTKKINTIAVLIGAVGYVLMYVSLITIASKAGYSVSIVMYAIAIMLFVMLCGIGIKANLMNPKIHRVIEISNVICQFLVALSTALLFTFI